MGTAGGDVHALPLVDGPVVGRDRARREQDADREAHAAHRLGAERALDDVLEEQVDADQQRDHGGDAPDPEEAEQVDAAGG